MYRAGTMPFCGSVLVGTVSFGPVLEQGKWQCFDDGLCRQYSFIFLHSHIDRLYLALNLAGPCV